LVNSEWCLGCEEFFLREGLSNLFELSYVRNRKFTLKLFITNQQENTVSCLELKQLSKYVRKKRWPRYSFSLELQQNVRTEIYFLILN